MVRQYPYLEILWNLTNWEISWKVMEFDKRGIFGDVDNLKNLRRIVHRFAAVCCCKCTVNCLHFSYIIGFVGPTCAVDVICISDIL